MKKLAYLASPFGFSESARYFMNNVYVPRLSQVVDIINPWDLTSQSEIDAAMEAGDVSDIRSEIGKRNAEAILKAEIVIAALDGQEPDSGTVAEIGFAAGVGKRVYGYRNDIRQAGELRAPFNLQVESFIHLSGGRIAYTLDELESVLRLDQGFASPYKESDGTKPLHEGEGFNVAVGEEDLVGISNFLFEVGMLAHSPRTGFHFLGSGKQSIAEHTNRTVYIGFVLSLMEPGIDKTKLLQMCLLHDLAEARTGDLNYVHQKYVESDEERAMNDLAQTLVFGDYLMGILGEYKERKSREAILAKDADNLEWILSLKEQLDIGNSRAESWLSPSIKRLKTSVAKALAHKILSSQSDDWWFGNKDDEWWINRNGLSNSKRF